MMMNGKDVIVMIGMGKRSSNVIADVVRKRGGGPAAVYDELFMMTLSRHPTAAEVSKLEQVRLGAATVKLGTSSPPAKGPAKGPKQPSSGVAAAPGAAPGGELAFYQDVFWALLNTNEFMLNH